MLVQVRFLNAFGFGEVFFVVVFGLFWFCCSYFVGVFFGRFLFIYLNKNHALHLITYRIEHH